ncbi:adenylyl-sulfate kinase [Caballeronia sp. dw_19]|uniref:adenylyl-sulfate kinase n=1 Tax=Caballeronia sp. dw_19 TaxID=2719791 RepID=UPI001BD32CE3
MRTDTHNAQTGCCYWLTGLSGAGKSTIAIHAAQNLRAHGYRVSVLDGDELRTGLNCDLGFSREDRAENVRRIGEVARLMVDAGLIVLVSAISPYQVDREVARCRIGDHRCFTVLIDTPLQTCIERDPKGLYARARAGEIKGMTGWDDPYESPCAPDISIATKSVSAEAAAQQIEQHYRQLIHGH